MLFRSGTNECHTTNRQIVRQVRFRVSIGTIFNYVWYRLVFSYPSASSLEVNFSFLQRRKDHRYQTLLDILPSVRNWHPPNHPKCTTCSQRGKTFYAHHSLSSREIVEVASRHIVSWERDKTAGSWLVS